MKILTLILYLFLLLSFSSCGATATKDTAENIVDQNNITDGTLSDHTPDIELINAVYNKFVFFDLDSDSNENPELYFTENALKKLQNDYYYEYGDVCDDVTGYAYYSLRTSAQDSNPESDGSSQILSIEPQENGWYIVSFSDMGWDGKTRVKIKEGKIDKYERIEQ